MPFGILNKETVLSYVNVHRLSANRTIWNHIAWNPAVGSVFKKLHDQFLIFIKLVVACLAALQKPIIPLGCKNPFIFKTVYPELMFHIGCYYKILLTLDQLQQLLIDVGFSDIIPVCKDVPCPVGPELFRCLKLVE